MRALWQGLFIAAMAAHLCAGKASTVLALFSLLL
jgi:hypothetical protein